MNIFQGILSYCILISIVFQKGNLLKTGAPCSAIETMKPVHPGVTETFLPYFDNFQLRYTDENDTEIPQRCYNERMTIRVRFKSEGQTTFRGFAIQARSTNDSRIRVGDFQESKYARLHCDEPGAVTHIDATPLSTEEFFVTWRPYAYFRGTVYFNITLAHDKDVWKSVVGRGNTLSYDANCAKTSNMANDAKSTKKSKSIKMLSTASTETLIKLCSNKITETMYTGPYTCGNMDGVTNDYFHVEKGSKAKIDGAHYICDGCIFEVTKNSSYISTNSDIHLLPGVLNASSHVGTKLSLKLQNFMVSNSNITLENSSMQSMVDAVSVPDATVSNISIKSSEINFSGVNFGLCMSHFMEIKNSQINIQSEHNSVTKTINLGGVAGCIKWTSSRVNLSSEVVVEAFGPWVMEPNSKIEANGPFLLSLTGHTKPLNFCNTKTRGLHLLSGSSIIVQPYARDGRFLIDINKLSMLLIGYNKTLEFRGHFRLIIDEFSQFYILESMILNGNTQTRPDLNIGNNLNCTFKINNQPDEEVIEIKEPVMITADNPNLITGKGSVGFKCLINSLIG